MTIQERFKARSRPLLMHPAVFVSGFLVVGLLFAVQQWVGLRMWYTRVQIGVLPVAAAWELQYLLWGIFCWLLWFWLGVSLQKAKWTYLLFRILPLSILMSVAVESRPGGGTRIRARVTSLRVPL